MKKQLLIAMLLSIATSTVWGMPSIVLDESKITYGGPGCPLGTARISVTPDGSAVTVLFDQFVVESGGDSRRRMDRKSCNLSIPVSVPSGYSVAVIQTDYRGFNSLPRGARSQFNVEYFWAGSRGPQLNRTFVGPLNSDFFIRNELLAHTWVWTPCGADVNLRINASIMNQTNSWHEQTYTSLDSADISGEIIYHIRYRRC